MAPTRQSTARHSDMPPLAATLQQACLQPHGALHIAQLITSKNTRKKQNKPDKKHHPPRHHICLAAAPAESPQTRARSVYLGSSPPTPPLGCLRREGRFGEPSHSHPCPSSASIGLASSNGCHVGRATAGGPARLAVLSLRCNAAKSPALIAAARPMRAPLAADTRGHHPRHLRGGSAATWRA